MNKETTMKKMSEILRTDIEHIIPALEKIKKETEEQEKEIKRLEERV